MVWLIVIALVIVAGLVLVLNRRGGRGPTGSDDTWRDAGLPPGTGATRPFPGDGHGVG